jgi:hypothetical protein
MSIEVTSNYRPARPNLAIVVSGILLALTLAGAGALTYVRKHPISLATAQNVPGVQGLRMAWPEDWAPVRLLGGPGPIIAGFASGGRGGTSTMLFLVAERVSDTYVSPRYAASHVLQLAARQLGFVAVSDQFVSSAEEMLGRPAFQIKYAVNYRQHVFWSVLRVVGEPSGMAIGLLLLTDEQISPASERIVDAVANSMELRRKPLDVVAGLGTLRLTARPGDNADLTDLRAYVQEMSVAGPIGVTLVPEGSAGIGQYYAINVWTSWLANRRTLQGIAGTWYRRQFLEADPPRQGGWVQRSGSRIWKLTLAERISDTDTLVDALYLKELPDKRVVWAHTTAGAGANPESLVLDLLASIQPLEPPAWTYDAAITAAGTVLADIADGPAEQYYRVNQGRRDLVYTTLSGQREGTGQFVTTVTEDGTLTRSEQIEIGPKGELFASQKQSRLRGNLSAYQVKELTQHGSGASLKVNSGRPDAASPISVVLQFRRGEAIQASLTPREPFLPDPAIETVAWQLAREPGTTALFRIVGMDPEVPESLLVAGLGRKEVETTAGRIDAWTCLLQEDTADGPTLVLFDENGGLIGYVLQGGTSLLRTGNKPAESQPTPEAD